MIDLDELEESSLIDVDNSKDDSIDNIKLEPKEIKIDNIEKDDEEVTISSKALDSLMSDSDNTVEVDMDEEDNKNVGALGDIYNISVPNSGEKSEDVPEITPTVLEKVEDKVPEITQTTEEKPEVKETELSVMDVTIKEKQFMILLRLSNLIQTNSIKRMQMVLIVI